MLKTIQNFWDNHGFEFLLVLSIIAILILALFRIGKKGTWSTSYNYSPTNSKPTSQRRAPKESSGEKECRRVLQNIFNKPFKNCRPDFLRNNVTGGLFNLELDCYEPSLKLGVEYDGAQHYKYIPFFHRNKEAFRNQQYRDEIKQMLCKQNNVNLIRVPYTVKVDEIENFLKKRLSEIGYI